MLRRDINAYLTPHYSVLNLLSFRDFLNLNRAAPDLQGATLLPISQWTAKPKTKCLWHPAFFLAI